MEYDKAIDKLRLAYLSVAQHNITGVPDIFYAAPIISIIYDVEQEKVILDIMRVKD